jgi:hypothetical protein
VIRKILLLTSSRIELRAAQSLNLTFVMAEDSQSCYPGEL